MDVLLLSLHICKMGELQSMNSHMCQDTWYCLDSQMLRGQISEYFTMKICQDVKWGNNFLEYFATVQNSLLEMQKYKGK